MYIYAYKCTHMTCVITAVTRDKSDECALAFEPRAYVCFHRYPERERGRVEYKMYRERERERESEREANETGC